MFSHLPGGQSVDDLAEEADNALGVGGAGAALKGTGNGQRRPSDLWAGDAVARPRCPYLCAAVPAW